MAKRATTDNVQADMQPPNYRGAVQRIRTIETKRKKIAGVNGEIGAIWAQVEGFRVNKTAAQFFDKLDHMELVDRNDVLRSLQGLVDASGWEQDAEDLMDKAEGRVIPMRFNQSAAELKGDAGAQEEGEDGAEDGDGEIDTDSILSQMERNEAAEQITGTEEQRPDDSHPGEQADGFVEATDEELKAQAGRGKTRKLKAVPQAAPFTGDNSDLGKA